MIVVTGTKRSGTSMWMQVLRAAGYSVVGDPFPYAWKNTIAEANPRGFWESPWRKGINWETNPDSTTGVYVPASAVTRHVVKIFPPGVVRTEREYLGQTIVCMRSWREYAHSITRLHAMERDGKERLRGETVAPRKGMPPVFTWWDENFALIRDIAIRQYPARFVTYDRALRAPASEIAEFLKWLGGGDVDAAVAAVAPELRTQHIAPNYDSESDITAGLGIAQIAVLDALHETVDASQSFSPALLTAMNQLHTELVPRIEEARAGLIRPKAGRRRIFRHARGGLE